MRRPVTRILTSVLLGVVVSAAGLAGLSPAAPVAAITTATSTDFNGNGLTDQSVFRPASGGWFARDGVGADLALGYGIDTDVAVPADYDGDLDTDVAIFRPSTALWAIHTVTPPTDRLLTYGIGTDTPVPADYDDDAIADVAIFRPEYGLWAVRGSSTNTDTVTTFGIDGDLPVPADYDGDGEADLAVFRPSTGTWFVRPSSGLPVTATSYGIEGDIPVPSDYDGDGQADVGIFRPSTGLWAVQGSSGSTIFVTYGGVAGDVPVPGRYDGDALYDIGIFRPASGGWYTHRSSDGVDAQVTFGIDSDVPLPLPAAIRSAFFPVTPLPVISGITPASGPATGGTTVVITGQHFAGATSVMFGTTVASFTVDSDTQITATSPPGTSGVVDVTVRNATGASNTSSVNKFEYTCPEHQNGLGQTYVSCSPLGTPGNPATYTLTMAQGAAEAWPPSGTTFAATCSGSSALVKQTATSAAVWQYAGSNAGRVRLNTTNNSAFCPGAADPTWD